MPLSPYPKKPIRKILIVEDEVIIGMALAAELEDLGYQVVEVLGSGEEAWSFLQEEEVDLLLLDVKLKGKWNGLETLSKIREFANPFAIFVSGNSESFTLNQIQNLKVDGFLVKPVNMEELHELIEAIERAQVG